MTRAKAHILLVDDDPVMRELASARLESAGHRVSAATNGEEGLVAFRERGADLVITDLDMPELDGYALIRAIRADPKRGATPIICITGSDHTDAVERVFAEGATSFLSKPINWTLFSQSVMFVLRASEGERQLRIARDAAESGLKFKDALMSVMSHELRTPLNAIIGFGQLIGKEFDRLDDKTHQQYADYIVDGGKRLLETISDILLASDVSSGPLALSESDHSLRDLIDEGVAIARRRTGSSAGRIEIKLRDEEVELRGDRALLSRALSKIIENALCFAGPDPIVKIAAAIAKSGDLAIMIEDDGPGVPAETIKKISAPFTQSDMSLRRSKEGLGLGLPMANAIFKAHQASLRLQSPETGGLRAVIVAPRARLVAASVDDAA